MSKITYRNVRRLLGDLGFEARPAQGSHVLYVHRSVASGRAVLPWGRDGERVSPSFWLGIRRMLLETGILSPEEADDRVSA